MQICKSGIAFGVLVEKPFYKEKAPVAPSEEYRVATTSEGKSYWVLGKDDIAAYDATFYKGIKISATQEKLDEFVRERRSDADF